MAAAKSNASLASSDSSKKAGKKAEAEAKRVRQSEREKQRVAPAAVPLLRRHAQAAAATRCPAAACGRRARAGTALGSPPPLPPGSPPQAAELAEAQAWVDAARATPAGDKKQLPAEMPKGYVPKAVEAAWCAAAPAAAGPSWCSAVPPPLLAGAAPAAARWRLAPCCAGLTPPLHLAAPAGTSGGRRAASSSQT